MRHFTPHTSPSPSGTPGERNSTPVPVQVAAWALLVLAGMVASAVAEPVIRFAAWAVLVAGGYDPGPWSAWGSL